MHSDINASPMRSSLPDLWPCTGGMALAEVAGSGTWPCAGAKALAMIAEPRAWPCVGARALVEVAEPCEWHTNWPLSRVHNGGATVALTTLGVGACGLSHTSYSIREQGSCSRGCHHNSFQTTGPCNLKCGGPTWRATYVHPHAYQTSPRSPMVRRRATANDSNQCLGVPTCCCP